MKTFFHILNPNRSNAKGVRHFFDANPGLEHMWVERTSHPTHLETVTQWAIKEGRPRIAVWGGDGTLSRVVQCLYNLNALEKSVLALSPVGTCNDFARKMNFSGWKKWAKAGLRSGGGEKGIDVGMLSSWLGVRTFINNAGFGRAPAALGRKSSPVRDIFSFTEKRLDLDWTLKETRQFETRSALLGIVFNAPYFNGGMHFDKSVRPDDNVLNAYFEAPQSRWGLLLKFLKSRLGGSLKGRSTFALEMQSLRMESNADLFPQVDGEAAFPSAVRSLEFSLLPSKLRLLI